MRGHARVCQYHRRARAVSSAGQSTCLTSRGSLVRVQYRPYAFHPASRQLRGLWWPSIGLRPVAGQRSWATVLTSTRRFRPAWAGASDDQAVIPFDCPLVAKLGPPVVAQPAIASWQSDSAATCGRAIARSPKRSPTCAAFERERSLLCQGAVAVYGFWALADVARLVGRSWSRVRSGCCRSRIVCQGPQMG
jgi:hypothetical protein